MTFGSKLFDTQIVILKFFFGEKVNFEKSQQITKKIIKKLTSIQRVKIFEYALNFDLS